MYQLPPNASARRLQRLVGGSDPRPPNITLAIIGTEDYITGDNEQFQQISIEQMLGHNRAQHLSCREDDHLTVHA